jgi:acetyl-CoA carboxylase beta subunit
MEEAILKKETYSGATLPQRLAALFDGNTWQDIATDSGLCLAEGEIAGRPVLVVATNPAVAQGTFGIGECADFRWALGRARATDVPLVLLIDSAGTRLTAGLAVQGAIRALLRDVLEARFAEAPMLAVLGRYAFGSASMLAFAAHARLYSENTLLAMSGPRVLQAALEDSTVRDTVPNRINGVSRAAVGEADTLIADELDAYAQAVREWVAHPAAASVTRDALIQERGRLAQRLSGRASGAPRLVDGPVLERDTLRCLADRPFGAADAIAAAALAESACLHAGTKPLTIAIDCPGHSILLQDEEIILSQYLVHLALSLRLLVREGASIRLLVAGNVSGGIYIAFSAATSTTELAPGAVIRTLPRSSLVQIFGEDMQEEIDNASYVEWGLAEKVLVPGHHAGAHSNPLEYVCIPAKTRASA